MNISKYKISLAVLSAVFALLLFQQSVGAIAGEAGNTEENQATVRTLRATDETVRTTRTGAEDDVQTAVSKKLDAVKLKVCQKRELIIKNVMTRMSDRGDKQMQVFDKIVERVKAFYVEKGYVVADYDTLVAAVDDARAALVAVNQNNATAGDNFTCDSSDPKGHISDFKEKETARIQAMKAYKTAIQKLITAIKSVATSSTTKTETTTNEN